MWATAARQLQANLGHAERRTHPEGLAVSGRRGQPCRRCGTPIRMARHGDLARSTYWCPTCQPPPTNVGERGRRMPAAAVHRRRQLS